MESLKVIIFIFSLSLISTIYSDPESTDTIVVGKSITDGQTIVSASQSFELGFFSPGNSKNRYLGIWYNKIAHGTVVWVANRESPIFDSSGTLKLISNGILILQDSTNDSIWSTNATRIPRNHPVAILLDSGNFVIRDGNDDNENFLWQSFDYIGDTLLPEMKFGRDLDTGFDRYLSSWKSADDPAKGDYVFQIVPTGFPQLILRKGSTIQFRAGSWNGVRWTGAGAMIKNAIYTYEFVATEKEVYYKYTLLNTSVLSRMVLNSSGASERFTWIDRTQSWLRYYSVIQDQCDNYAMCGANSVCDISKSPVCVCLASFVPKSPRYWGLQDWSDGCVRKTALGCDSDEKEGFLKITGVKLPDTSHSRVNKSIGLEECNKLCLKNCSCMAYANSDIRGAGSGCLLWFTDLLDIRTFPVGGQDLYLRLSASDLAHIETKTKWSGRKLIVVMIGSIVSFVVLLAIGCIFFVQRRKLITPGRTKGYIRKEIEEESMREDTDLPIYDLKTIVTATDNFSLDKKLGEGGFGPVYKGTLIDGQEIAVKRLSKSSGQGLKEFMNEVLLIAKLQHRNLVKLLGCCVHEDERMLIYEYMPNKSLDFFIFDPIRARLLDQRKRIDIIGGIARGLLYLHQDSRLRIIHRDLKASNVLLDTDMNPKISDFGLARSFGGDEISGNTNKVVGTYGYMSPEYAIDGLFSVKSDVYSFGVLVLEIVSGKKNRGFQHQDHNHNLLGHAWKLWTEGRPLELVDECLDDSCALSEILRCIQVGVLCVQQKPEDRPNMSTVVLMLGSDGTLPEPMQPGFFAERNFPESESSTSKQESCSTNGITVTLVEPR